jgi:hypothetical protein
MPELATKALPMKPTDPRFAADAMAMTVLLDEW